MTSTTALDTDPPERPESPGASRVATRIEQQLAAAQTPVAEALVRMTAELRRVADALATEKGAAKYPYADGDVTVLGPEVIVSKDRSVISWQGHGYRLVADEGTWTAGGEAACCCICGIATAGTHRGAPFCSDCADCGCNQNPCVRLGINDPAVSATPADCGPECAEQHTYASDCEAASEPDGCPTPETHNWGCACTTIHACPPDGSGLTPCCGRPPVELLADRMTDEPARVTCRPAPPVGALRDQLAEALMRSYAKRMKLPEIDAAHPLWVNHLTDADAVLPVIEQHTAQLREKARSRGEVMRLEPDTETELREQLMAALLAEHQRRAGEQTVVGSEEHCAALAGAVMPTMQWALDGWRKEHAELRRLEQVVEENLRFRQEADSVYRERADLIALLAAHYPAVMTHAPDTDEDGWALLFLDLPTGQASWHIAPRDLDLLQHVELVGKDDPRAQWDGHATEEKYDRIRAHARMRAAERDWPWADRQAEKQRQLTAAVAAAVPVLRRALEQLPESCWYHGGQFTADNYRRGEACCDTGIPALRRWRAAEALKSLTATKEIR